MTIAPGTAAGTALGSVYTISAQFSNCSAPAGATTNLFVGVGSTMTPTFVQGVNYQIVGTPSLTKSASCPAISTTVFSNSVQASVNPAAGYANCTFTLTASGRFYLGTSRIRGDQVIPTSGASNAYSSFTGVCPSGSCGTFTVGSQTKTGAVNIPVYVTACAGVINATQTVQLPKVSTSTFLSNTTAAGKTPFEFSLDTCLDKANNGEAGNTGYDAHVSWTFTHTVANNVIDNTGGTSSVKVQILKSNATTPVDATIHDVYVLTPGTNVLKYYAAYVNPSGAAVTPGTVRATAMVTVTYQ